MTKNRRARKARSSAGRANSLMAYAGPIHLPVRDGLDDQSIRVNLTYTVEAGSNGGGILTGYFANSDVTSTTDFSSYASAYQEYRVLGMELKYVNRYNNTATTYRDAGAGAMCTSHISSIGTPANLDAVAQVADHKAWRTGAPLTVHWRARGVEEMVFNSTAGTATHGGIQYYCATGTADVSYGKFFITFLVEFRARK